MTLKPIVRIQGLGKRYKIGERASYGNLRESLTTWLKGSVNALHSVGRIRSSRKIADDNYIWALRDATLDIMPGEVLGVIGRNGAGKSTLLKILSRITQPTTGRVDLYGRVGSLLEVGTGFHPELTGRENIYLSGAILGMRRAEIQRKFDEIVAFAEVETFIDTPVKHYSSGMYVRIAFAVAAHLDPEILLVDEVLAVGDQSFQRKCLGKMGEVARGGRTVVLVSHNLPSIESLCSSCILVDAGSIAKRGSPTSVIGDYFGSYAQSDCGRNSLVAHRGRLKNSRPIMKSVSIGSGDKTPVSAVRMGAAVSIAVEFESKTEPLCPVLGVVVKTSQGWPVFGLNNRFIGGYRFDDPVDSGTITCRINQIPLTPGRYIVDLYFGDHHQDLDAVFEAITFDVVPSDVFGTGRIPPEGVGPIYLPAAWELIEGATSPRNIGYGPIG